MNENKSPAHKLLLILLDREIRDISHVKGNLETAGDYADNAASLCTLLEFARRVVIPDEHLAGFITGLEDLHRLSDNLNLSDVASALRKVIVHLRS